MTTTTTTPTTPPTRPDADQLARWIAGELPAPEAERLDRAAFMRVQLSMDPTLRASLLCLRRALAARGRSVAGGRP